MDRKAARVPASVRGRHLPDIEAPGAGCLTSGSGGQYGHQLDAASAFVCSPIECQSLPNVNAALVPDLSPHLVGNVEKQIIKSLGKKENTG